MNLTNIYILKLTNNKYYIGYTNDIAKRINEHFEGNGSSFTKKYKPIQIIKIIKEIQVNNVDQYIFKYMKKFGIDNVRGGSFKNEILTKSQKEILKQNNLQINPIVLQSKPLKIEISNRIHPGTCIKCLKDGHKPEECEEIYDKYNNRINNENNNKIKIEFKY